MKGVKPTAAICLAMQQKVDQDEKLNALLEKRLNPLQLEKKTTSKKKAIPAGHQAEMTSPPTSMSSWAEVPKTAGPTSPEKAQAVLEDLQAHLTLEEKQQIEQLVNQRRALPVPEELLEEEDAAEGEGVPDGTKENPIHLG